MNDKNRELCEGLGQLASISGQLLGLVSEMMVEPAPPGPWVPTGKTFDQVPPLPTSSDPYHWTVAMLKERDAEIVKLKGLLNEALEYWARKDPHKLSIFNRDAIRKQASLW